MGAQEEGAIITILVTASQYGLSLFFMCIEFILLLAGTLQKFMSVPGSSSGVRGPSRKRCRTLLLVERKSRPARAPVEKRVRRASAMLAHWGIEVFLGHCDPRKELTGMPLGHHYHHTLMLVWPHFHRSRLFNSRVKRNYT